MILDKEALFADKLASDGTPTDLDLGSVRPGPGRLVKMFITVSADVSGMTGFSLTDSDDGSTFAALLTHTENLAGKTLEIDLPSDVRRYVRCNLAGSVSGGNWTAGVVLPGVQTNE